MTRRPVVPQPIPAPEPTHEPPSDLYTIEEAADYFRCSRSVMFDLIKEWNIKTVPVGRKRLISIWEMQRVARERENVA